jgi:hypothetical protein
MTAKSGSLPYLERSAPRGESRFEQNGGRLVPTCAELTGPLTVLFVTRLPSLFPVLLSADNSAICRYPVDHGLPKKVIKGVHL